VFTTFFPSPQHYHRQCLLCFSHHTSAFICRCFSPSARTMEYAWPSSPPWHQRLHLWRTYIVAKRKSRMLRFSEYPSWFFAGRFTNRCISCHKGKSFHSPFYLDLVLQFNLATSNLIYVASFSVIVCFKRYYTSSFGFHLFYILLLQKFLQVQIHSCLN